jgi:tetratricopeptide (TPR) repeat protein
MTELRTTVKNILKSDNKKKKKRTKIDYLIGGIIYLIFFLCPIFFTGLVSQGIGFEKIMLFYFLVLSGVVLWTVKGVMLGELDFKRTPLDIPIVAALLFLTISTVLSVSIKDSLIGSYGNSAKGMIAIVIFILFYYLLVNNIDKKRIKGIFLSFLASGSLVAIFSLLQLLGVFIVPIEAIKNNAFNPVGSLTNLTIYLVALLPFFVVGATQVKEIFPNLNKSFAFIFKVALLAIIVIILATLAILNGFTFWPVAIVGMVIVSMFFLSKIIKVNNNNVAIPLLVFLFLVIMLVLGNFKIGSLTLPAEVSLSRRASMDIAKNALLENPIFGSGPATFYYDFSKFKTNNFNSSQLWNVRFESASGAIFEFLATFGLLGTIAIVVSALIALSVIFLTLIKSKEEYNSVLLASFASFTSILLFAVLFSQDSALIILTVLISVFTISLAFAIYPEKLRIMVLSFRSSAKYALALAAIFLSVSACVVVLFTMGIKMYLADVYVKKALLTNNQKEKLAYLERAVELAPYQDSYYLIIANSYMSLANQAANEEKDQSTIGQNLSLAIDKGRKAVELSPNKASNNESLALIYENASFYTRGALEWAETLYKKVSELDPRNPVPELRMALINMARANSESEDSEKEYYINEAIRKYDEAIAKKEDLAAAYYGKAIASENLENIDTAIEELKRANLIAGGNTDYQFELGRMLFNRGVAQPNISQNASRQIAEEDIVNEGEEGEEDEEISVTPSRNSGVIISRNSDIDEAEQVFLNIIKNRPNHANAVYSLAVLYQKIGEGNNIRKMVGKLFDIVEDEETLDAIRQQFRGYY